MDLFAHGSVCSVIAFVNSLWSWSFLHSSYVTSSFESVYLIGLVNLSLAVKILECQAICIKQAIHLSINFLISLDIRVTITFFFNLPHRPSKVSAYSIAWYVMSSLSEVKYKLYLKWLIWVNKLVLWSCYLWCLILHGCWLFWQNKILFFTSFTSK